MFKAYIRTKQTCFEHARDMSRGNSVIASAANAASFVRRMHSVTGAARLHKQTGTRSFGLTATESCTRVQWDSLQNIDANKTDIESCCAVLCILKNRVIRCLNACVTRAKGVEWPDCLHSTPGKKVKNSLDNLASDHQNGCKNTDQRQGGKDAMSLKLTKKRKGYRFLKKSSASSEMHAASLDI